MERLLLKKMGLLQHIDTNYTLRWKKMTVLQKQQLVAKVRSFYETCKY